eukprot:jgi/Ulvmu1/2577/UM014_0028.1
MSDRVLYWLSGSPPCWRVMAVLEEKGLPYESKLINASKGELKSEELMAINPRGQAPTFKDGDIIVNESMALMHYLEEAYPEVPLLPKGTADRALALQRLHEITSLYSAIQPLFYAKMVGKVNTDFEKEQFEEGIKKAHKELQYFEDYLSDGRMFLTGEMFTLADINLAIVVFFGQRAGATFEKYPNLLQFGDRLRDRPCFKGTWPPHWLESENKDWLTGL